jgi:hypothetical protein
MAKKQTPKQLKKILWELCRKITLKKYGNTCYTCSRTNLMGSNCQLGHFLPSGACGAFLRYNLCNLRIQCYHCNINLGGNGAEYYKRLVAEVGQEAVDQIFKDKQKSVKCDSLFLSRLIAEYEDLLQ